MDYIRNNIDLILTIITTVVIPLLGFLTFQLFRRPRLEIDSIKMTGSRKRGHTTNYPHDSDETPYAEELNYNYEYRIPFEFSVVNNSEIDGYDAEIQFDGIQDYEFWIDGDLNFSPITAHEKHVFHGNFYIEKEAGFRNPPKIGDIQRDLRENLEIKTKVKNKYRAKSFYSVFDGSENEFKFFNPMN